MKTHLISVLIFTIVLRILLDSIICQMNVLIIEIRNIELFTTCSNEAILIEITLKMSIYWRHKPIASEIEFTILDQERMIYILLNNKSLFFDFSCCSTLAAWIRDKWLNLGKARWNINTITSVCVLSWFNNPYISRDLISSFDISHYLIFFKVLVRIVLGRRVITSAIVIFVIISFVIVIASFVIVSFYPRRLFSWNWSTFVLLFSDCFEFFVSLLKCVCSLSFSLFRDLGNFSKILSETAEFSTRSISGFNQIGERKNIERVLTELAVVVTHINENTLLIS